MNSNVDFKLFQFAEITKNVLHFHKTKLAKTGEFCPSVISNLSDVEVKQNQTAAKFSDFQGEQLNVISNLSALRRSTST